MQKHIIDDGPNRSLIEVLLDLQTVMIVGILLAAVLVLIF